MRWNISVAFRPGKCREVPSFSFNNYYKGFTYNIRLLTQQLVIAGSGHIIPPHIIRILLTVKDFVSQSSEQ